MSQIDTTVIDKFHEDSGQLRDVYGMQRLYMTLINEEYRELSVAHYSGTFLECIKESLDLIVVAYGYAKASAEALGMPLKPFWDELDRELLSKYKEDGTFIRREDGKILKPDTFKKADFSKVWGDYEDA
jgi:hypothetical protein